MELRAVRCFVEVADADPDEAAAALDAAVAAGPGWAATPVRGPAWSAPR